MTPKQAILKAIYPVIAGASRLFGSKATALTNKQQALPPESLYDVQFIANNGKPSALNQYKGKKLLLVNTASNCGYTGQYDDLQELYKKFNDKLVIIAFPSNDFLEQEKGDDKEIEGFCRMNYGVTFPLASKSVVTRKADQNPVFNWLTDPAKNGWNTQQPEWNFSKYLIDEQGTLIGYFGAAISPLDNAIVQKITADR